MAGRRQMSSDTWVLLLGVRVCRNVLSGSRVRMLERSGLRKTVELLPGTVLDSHLAYTSALSFVNR